MVRLKNKFSFIQLNIKMLDGNSINIKPLYKSILMIVNIFYQYLRVKFRKSYENLYVFL